LVFCKEQQVSRYCYPFQFDNLTSKLNRKYYDDCAQILSEHILALKKPDALKTFSTLDPLVTTSVQTVDDSLIEDEPRRRPDTFLARAARMLQGESHEGESDSDSRKATSSQKVIEDGNVDPVLNLATTLDEGALPVREFPNNLTSEPASLVQSANSSVTQEERRFRSSSVSLNEPHSEELRCVVAIVRHGDRTPKVILSLCRG